MKGLSSWLNRGILILLIVGLLGVPLVAAQGEEEESITFVRPLMGVAGFDPATSGDSESGHLMAMVYNTLTTVDREGKVIPSLAKGWAISPDFQEYTLYLREGIKFHDGTPFTADAVKYSFDRMLRVGRTAYGYYSNYATEDTIEVIGEYTVKFTFKEPWALFLVDLITDAYKIVNPAYVRAHAADDDPWALKWLHDHECGTGPFELVEWIHGDRILFREFGEYWLEESKPRVDKVIFKLVTDPGTAAMMLERGDVDIVEKLTMDQFIDLHGKPGINVVNFAIPKITYLTMDVTQSPLDNPKVRQAIAYAINYEDCIEYAEMGFAEELRGLSPKGMLSYSPDLFRYRQDLDKARELLKEAGYPDGFTTQLTFSLERRATFEDVATLIKSYLAEIGIKVELKKVAFSTQIEMQESGGYGLSLMVWTAVFPDPEDILGWLADGLRSSGGWNGSHWIDDRVVDALNKARSITDQEERRRHYQMIDKIIVDEAIYIPLYTLGHPFAMRDWIEGFYYDSFTHSHFCETNTTKGADRKSVV